MNGHTYFFLHEPRSCVSLWKVKNKNKKIQMTVISQFPVFIPEMNTE